MCYAQSVDAAHMTSGTGGDEHIARRQRLRWSIQIKQMFLSLEHDTVLRFLVDFDLGVIGTHMTLCARGRQTGDVNRTRVPRMAGRAVANRAVGVRPPDAVALLTTAYDRGAALHLHKRMWWSPSSAGLIGFRKINLFGGEALFAIHGSP